ncbi:MAG: type II toxin-antitoxin system Phd/YefM family antitoxin [Actinobacteria bacterium]|nr:type II toxin-antitoxin system Phd/YefM family antitoxin [Actinomycetota bacterium]
MANPAISQTVTLTEAEARFTELVALVEQTREHINITRNGAPAAVLVSHTELEALRETIAILCDPAMVADLREAEADIAAGNTVDAESLRESMQARRRTSA